jgi:DNA-binding beta-propeller fold protein YncE
VRTVLAILAALAVVLAPAGAAFAKEPPKPKKKQAVLYVGNNWDGTADIVHATKFKNLARLNIIPDFDERMAEIMSNPDRLGFFLGIRELVGEGHDQFVDDMFSSNDGRRLFVSRPSFADVIALNVRTGEIVWRTPVEGYRSDHMAISPDGKRVLVSASTGNVVHAIDTKTGEIVGGWASGDSPHENNYSADGQRVFHASIGRVYTPADAPEEEEGKGKTVFQIVDANTYEVLEEIDMNKKLEEFGRPDMSGAVRPMALPPSEKKVYFQVSFFHGFVEYDFTQDKVTRLAELPISDEAAALQREQYLLDSAHHGLAMDPKGKKLCVAGTMSDYGAIVHRKNFSHRIAVEGEKPYWSTNSGDGKYCFISFSGDDNIGVVSYRKEKLVKKVQVGDHPQRMRMGTIRRKTLAELRARG